MQAKNGGIAMYCFHCGAALPENAKFCRACGQPQPQEAATAIPVAPPAVEEALVSPSTVKPVNSLVGYSRRISDPAFAKYVESGNRWSAIFSIILAVIAVIGFYIAGEMPSSEMENPQSLFIGFGIGGMFLLIALFQVRSRNRSKTWDGVVVDKKIEQKKRKRNTSDDDYYWENYDLYTVVVRSESGKMQRITAENDPTVFNYFEIGDKVRHHGRLNTYEKYDKSRDSIIFCNACGTKHDINADYCYRCQCPLLK